MQTHDGEGPDGAERVKRESLPRGETWGDGSRSSHRTGKVGQKTRRDEAKRKSLGRSGAATETLGGYALDVELDVQAVSRAVLNLEEFVEKSVRTDLEWASMSPRALGLVAGSVARSTESLQPGVKSTWLSTLKRDGRLLDQPPSEI